MIFPFNSNKVFYDGEWSNGQIQGKGLFRWTDGSEYEGDFVKGKKDGLGKFTFANGCSYEGYWVDGKQDGAGTLFNKEKVPIKKGDWQNGVFLTTLEKEDFEKKIAESSIKK